MKSSAASPRVALISVGLGRVQRGFERYFAELFGVLGDDFDVTLYKSGGKQNAREKVPPLLRQVTSIARALPLEGFAGHAEYNRDCLAFGLTLMPQLLRKRFDVLHCIDPPMAFVLQHLLGLCRRRTKVLFTDGCIVPAEFYPRVAHLHHVAKTGYDAARARGYPASHMTMIPPGIHAAQYAVRASRRELREKYQVADDAFVVLAISALKRTHKRVDYIVDEVSQLRGNVLLWLDGNLEDPSVVEFARHKLGARCRITHVRSTDVAELYGMADVMVHASLSEAFGRAIVEAVCGGLMVLVHNSPHFEWLVEDRECLVDMSVKGSLAGRLDQLRRCKQGRGYSRDAAASRMFQRFDWTVLAPAYKEMYRRVSAMVSESTNVAAVA
jgi:glycosyltransferase involved in cell wall biosynthesis